MKFLAKYAVAAALLAGGVAVGTVEPAQAQVSFSIGFGGPSYYGYDYYRPCSWYYRHDYPAPRRCYDDYRGYYGSGIYISDGFVFRDRRHYGHWRHRDDYRRWRTHDWTRHDGGDRGGWDRHDRGDRGDWDRHDRGDRHDGGRHDGEHHHHH